MFKNKEDGRYRIEMKFKDGEEASLISDNYNQICEWYNLLRRPLSTAFSANVCEVILWDQNKPIASWCNNLAVA